MALAPDQPGTVYAGGQATTLPNKAAFYEFIAANPQLPAQEFSNNPWGVSHAEIQSNLGQTGGGPVNYGGTSGGVASGGGADTQGTVNQIGANYDILINALGEQQARAGSRQAGLQQAIGTQFGQQQSELERQKGVGEQKITRQKGFALKDLEGNIRSAFQAGQIRLGGLGAGDSSAAQTNYPYALTRLSNQNRGMIQRTAMEQMGDIENTFTGAMSQLNMWRSSELNRIADQFRAINDELELRKQNVSFERAQAIANLQLQLAQSAAQSVGAVNQQYSTAIEGVQAGQAPVGTVGTAAVQGVDVQGMGQFNPQWTTNSNLQGGTPLLSTIRPRREQFALQG